MRLIYAIGGVVVSVSLLAGCTAGEVRTVRATPSTAATWAPTVPYPLPPKNPDSLLECDRGAMVLEAIPDYGEPVGGAVPNTPREAAVDYADHSVKPVYGTQFKIAGANEAGNYMVLTLTAPKTVEEMVLKGKVAAVLTVSASPSGVWQVTGSSACA